MTASVSAGLVPLKAPIPSPREYDLLSAARLIQPDTNRWLVGGFTGGDVPGPAHTHDPCSTGTDRVKADAGDIAQQMSGTFNVYLTGFCTAQSVGPNPTFFTDRLKLAFPVYEVAAVERVLATGDGHSTLGSYLGDPNMEDLRPGGGPTGALRGLEILEEAIAEHGTGIIHAAPATALAWFAENLLDTNGRVASTKLGTPVAIGAGYIGVYPDGESPPAADQEWAFASGPIEVFREAEIKLVPDDYSQAFDRALNDVLYIAERAYLFNWIARQSDTDDSHVQAGVLIDLVP